MKKIALTRSTIAKGTIYALAGIFLLCAFIYGCKCDFGLDILRLENVQEANKDLTYKYKYIIPVDEMDSIDIDWSSGNVGISLYDGEDIRIVEASAQELTDDRKLITEADGYTLRIRWDRSLGPINVFPDIHYKNLSVKIPKTMVINKIDVDTTAAGVKISGIKASDITVATGSGSINTNKCKSRSISFSSSSGNISAEKTYTDELYLKTGTGNAKLNKCIGYTSEMSSRSGNIDFKGSFINMDAVTSSGAMNLTTDTATGAVALRSITGDIHLTAPSDISAGISFDTVSGEFSSNFMHADSSGEFFVGKNKGTVKFETTRSDVLFTAGDKAKDPVVLFPEETEDEEDSDESDEDSTQEE